MKRLAGFVVGIWVSAAVAAAGAAAKPTTATPPPLMPPPAVTTYVIVGRKAALRYRDEQIGELPEATRVTVLREGGEWALVRARFGEAWVQGWVSTALIAPDSLAKVDVKIGRATKEYSFERKSLPGYQFLIVRVQLTAREGAPSRLYFEFKDPETADLYLVHSRDRKVVPHGFMLQEPMSAKRTFETGEKRQTLELKRGEPLVEIYVFAVPPRARTFELVLKDVKRPVRIRR